MSDLLNQASLVVIPSGYKEDTVYSVVPSDGSGDLSFTRASNGTRINSAGLVEVCPWNYKTDSENLTVGSGLQGSDITTITANTTETTDPFGTNKAEKFDGSSGQLADTYNAIPENSVITSSIYAKAGSVSTFILRLSASFGTNAQATFNLSSGTITATSGDVYLNSTITPIGNGWYRCSITYNFISVPTNRILLNANGSLYFFGWQLNIGSTAKPYFPTTDRLNVPRLTYQNGGGGCPSLLLEKQSTNLVTYSEQFDNAAWTKVLSTITANDTTSPDGTQNADLLTTTNTGICYIYQLLSGTSGAYSASMYVKNGNNNYFALNVQGSAGNWAVAIFDLTNGSLGQYAQGANGGFVYVNHTITNVGNGWYRCVLNYTTTQSTYFCAMFAPLKTGNSFSAAYGEAQNNANNKTMYIWGYQIEASSYPTSYIPTTSASATRVADVCSKTGISSLIGQTQGTIFWDGVATQGDYNQLMFIKDSSSIQFIGLTIASGVIYGEVYNGGYVHLFSLAIASNATRFKLALAYKTNDFAFYVNGTQVATASTGTTPTSFDDLYLNNINDTRDFNCEVKQAIIFSTRLTNAELASLTTI
jgi:hypothetical protein